MLSSRLAAGMVLVLLRSPGRLLLLISVALSFAGDVWAQEDWPQWRGEDGMAVSSQSDLPSLLAPDSPHLLWRTAVLGEGISSPIVVGERVFVTSAYPGEIQSGTAAIRVLIPALCLFVLFAGLWVAFRKPSIESLGWPKLLGRIDSVGVALGTLVFVAGALLICFHGSAWVGHLLQALLGRSRLWESGSPGEIWLITGALAMLGGALAPGWTRLGSSLRPLGALLLLAAAWLLQRHVPLNQYAETYKLEIRFAMIAMGLAGALWHALVFLVCRRQKEGGTGCLGVLMALALLAVSAMEFQLQNFLAPSAGLVRGVLCFDLLTGEELWNTKLFVAPEGKKYPRNSYATPTPCATATKLFADFGSGYACLDHDGNILWMKRHAEFDELTRYGSSSSPVLHGNTIVLLHDKEIDLGPSYLMGLDFETGEQLWREESWKSHDSYTTPLVVERAGETQLVSVSFDRLNGHDASNGKLLWSLEIPVEQMVPSLQVRGDLLLLSGGSHLKFATMGVRLSGLGKDTQAEILWSTRRAVPNISSPVWVDDLFFTVTDGGIMTCYDPETGKVHWKERLGGTFWASLAAGDGKLFALGDAGKNGHPARFQEL